MKKLLIAAAGALFLANCAQKEEKREERKDELSAEHMRNSGVDSTATSGQTVSPTATDNTAVNQTAADSTSAK